MRTRIQKWGNSLAIRIPKPFADDVGIKEGSEVDVTVDAEEIVVSPVRARTFTLEDLLADVTEENLHAEVKVRGPVGNEIW
ncbi:MAG: AbrB/MazE/SpoVT family DNA-binding domain-containing protein [Gemmatimonadota bacterium]